MYFFIFYFYFYYCFLLSSLLLASSHTATVNAADAPTSPRARTAAQPSAPSTTSGSVGPAAGGAVQNKGGRPKRKARNEYGPAEKAWVVRMAWAHGNGVIPPQSFFDELVPEFVAQEGFSKEPNAGSLRTIVRDCKDPQFHKRSEVSGGV